jgi:hypothetical protein
MVMEQRIHIAEVNNQQSLCFDTGLDPRSFARTKMSQSLIDTGYIVNPDGTHETWKATGVNENGGFMRVFGPYVPGKRLDLLLEGISSISQLPTLKQETMEAVISWSKAKMFLGDTNSAINPGASFVSKEGNVFFAPEHISSRCLYIEGSEIDTYNCPDLVGMDITAFCAGVMLYKILTGTHPYPSKNILDDMREGVFLPVHLAAQGLNPQLAELIQAALMLPVEKKGKHVVVKKGIDILSGILEILSGKENKVVSVSSLFDTVSVDKTKHLENEKKIYLFKKNKILKTKRFILNNKPIIIGVAVGIAFVLFILFSTVISISSGPTTEGMAPDTVITAYYEAFSSLNHQFMDACIKGADRSDINAAATFYAVLKQRQAYEGSNAPSIIQARVWKDSGGKLPAPNVFGVTDLKIDYIGGEEEDGLIVFQTDYNLWSPFDDFARHRNDRITLKRDRRKHWRIIEILREES